MVAKTTVQVRADPDFAEQLRWLTEYEKATAPRRGRKPRATARILKDLAGRSVGAAFKKIEPWVKTMKAAMEAAQPKGA